MDISQLVQRQRAFFNTGATRKLAFRQRALDTLRRAIQADEAALFAALKQDLRKPATEAYMSELGLIFGELSCITRGLARWDKEKHVHSPLALLPSKSMIYREPYGVALIMAPWNYPVLLTLGPLIGAVAAGNCCIIKPSAYAPASSAAVTKLIRTHFPSEHVAVVEGGRAENQALLEQKFDYIFFTGGAETGRHVMEKAAKHLMPITLELGGKSPCIVDATARLDMAAKRVAFGKLINCGQTCAAPDYLLVDKRVKAEFLERLKYWIAQMYGDDPLRSDGYARMVNRRHFNRVCSLINPEQVVYGGQVDPDTLKIQPTILDGVASDDPVMQQEIFGPVLPVLEFEEIQQACDIIRQRPSPLALYLFSEDKALQHDIWNSLRFGGGCINDTVMQIGSATLPFGGVGESGMGNYHGKRSFEIFSREKSMVRASTRIDLPFRYPPYNEKKDKLMRFFVK